MLRLTSRLQLWNTSSPRERDASVVHLWASQSDTSMYCLTKISRVHAQPLLASCSFSPWMVKQWRLISCASIAPNRSHTNWFADLFGDTVSTTIKEASHDVMLCKALKWSVKFPN